ncbi:MAG: recombinase family protein [Lentisphaeraceae bacterium]|nr:recombinase family protein [Lentisphaeraceae bacterium]
MIIGYARTSTVEQEASFDSQQEILKGQGCEKIFCEQVSAVKERPQFEAMLNFAREGDSVVVVKLDRAFRDVRQALETADYLKAKGVGLRLMDLGGVDVNSDSGRLIFTCMTAFAEFERNRMIERQKIGIAKAKKDGKYANVGRKQTVDKEAIKKLLEEGHGKAAIAKKLGISRQTVYRAL